MSEALRIRTNEFAVYVRGKFNPAILNHDFLVNIGAIAQKTKLPEPVVTPDRALLKYKDIGLDVKVEINSFLVSQQTGDPETSHVIRLTSAYLRTLEYTPVKGLSLNFFGDVVFGELEDVARFEASLLTDKAKLVKGLKTDGIGAAVQLFYDFESFEAMMRLGPIDVGQSSVAFGVGYYCDTPDKEHISLLEDRERLASILKVYLEQLRMVFEGGVANATSD